jgi:hypothetical protein
MFVGKRTPDERQLGIGSNGFSVFQPLHPSLGAVFAAFPAHVSALVAPERSFYTGFPGEHVGRDRQQTLRHP